MTGMSRVVIMFLRGTWCLLRRTVRRYAWEMDMSKHRATMEANYNPLDRVTEKQHDDSHQPS